MVALVGGLVLAAALALSSPSGATAAPAPAGGVPAVTAAAYEWNVAVAGSVPSGLHCTERAGAKACFQPNGDKWWVKDTKADGHSATASWENYLCDGSECDLYRDGSCVNELGSGEWGVCNKNYYEGSIVLWQACVYDAGDGTWHGCQDGWQQDTA
jgi:hypothetical protein